MTHLALPPGLEAYAARFAAEDAEIAQLVGQVGSMSKSQLAALSKRIGLATRSTRTLLRITQVERRRLRREIRARCKAVLRELRTRRREVLAAARREAHELQAKERAEVLQSKHALDRLELDQGGAVKVLQARTAELKRQREKIDQMSGRHVQQVARSIRRAELQQESDDAVTYELEKTFPEALPWWHQNKTAARWRKGKSKMSRVETIVHFLHDNPDKVTDARVREADERVKEAEARQERLAAHQRRVGTQRERRRQGLAGRAGAGRAARVGERRIIERKRAAEASQLGPEDFDPFADPPPLPAPARAAPAASSKRYPVLRQALQFVEDHRDRLGGSVALAEAIRGGELTAAEASTLRRLMDQAGGSKLALKLLAREERQDRDEQKKARPVSEQRAEGERKKNTPRKSSRKRGQLPGDWEQTTARAAAAAAARRQGG